MSMFTRRRVLLLMFPFAFGCSTLDDLTLGVFSEEGQVQLSGAIFTTTDDGTVVNENVHYELKCDVYLNGGPAHEGAAGLPAGDYYFMVTDPSGMVLLSSDDITDRVVTVDASGRFVSAFNHRMSENEVDGGIVVQLCPYATTPNPGGEYKAWITPVEDYDPGAPGSVHGFVHSRTKTDNFKVKDEVTEPPPPGGGDGDGSEFDQN